MTRKKEVENNNKVFSEGIAYTCDPTKAVDCIKTECHINGGNCYATTHKEYAKYPTTLEDTIKGMTSEDYKERFKAEYMQLKIRYDKLVIMVDKYRQGKLEFEPKTPLYLLENQILYMFNYMTILKLRAEREDINLD